MSSPLPTGKGITGTPSLWALAGAFQTLWSLLPCFSIPSALNSRDLGSEGVGAIRSDGFSGKRPLSPAGQSLNRIQSLSVLPQAWGWGVLAALLAREDLARVQVAATAVLTAPSRDRSTGRPCWACPLGCGCGGGEVRRGAGVGMLGELGRGRILLGGGAPTFLQGVWEGEHRGPCASGHIRVRGGIWVGSGWELAPCFFWP